MPQLEQSEQLKMLCYDDGALQAKDQCHAKMINFLILEEMMDIDDAEDLAQKTLNELNLWPEEEAEG